MFGMPKVNITFYSIYYKFLYTIIDIPDTVNLKLVFLLPPAIHCRAILSGHQ